MAKQSAPTPQELIDKRNSIGEGITSAISGALGSDQNGQDAISLAKRAFAPKVPDLNRSDIFPGIDDPILKGMSSSKTLGSQPIFVGSGGFIPFNIMQKREAAKVEAAREAAKRQQAFQVGTPPTLDNPRFQQQFNDKFFETTNNFIDEAKQLHGESWDIALKSPETDVGRRFQQTAANFDVIARRGNEIFGRVAEIRKGQKDKSLFVDPETKNLLDEIEFKIGRFGEGDIGNLVDDVNKLEANMSLNEFIKDKGIMGRIKTPALTQEGIEVRDEGGFELVIERAKKSVEPQARELARLIKDEEYNDVDAISEDKIFNHLMSAWGDEQLQKVKTVKKTKGTGAGKRVKTEDVEVQENKEFLVGNNRIGSSISVPISSDVKPMNISGAKIINPETGESIKEDVQNVQPVEFVRLDGNVEQLRELVKTASDTDVSKDISDRKGPIDVMIGTRTVERPVPKLDSQGNEIKDDEGNVVFQKDNSGNIVTEEQEENVYILTEGNEARFTDETGNYYGRFKQETEKKKSPKKEATELTTNQQAALSEFGQSKFDGLSEDKKTKFLEKFK